MAEAEDAVIPLVVTPDEPGTAPVAAVERRAAGDWSLHALPPVNPPSQVLTQTLSQNAKRISSSGLGVQWRVRKRQGSYWMRDPVLSMTRFTDASGVDPAFPHDAQWAQDATMRITRQQCLPRARNWFVHASQNAHKMSPLFVVSWWKATQSSLKIP